MIIKVDDTMHAALPNGSPSSTKAEHQRTRDHPQTSFAATTIDPASFFGKIRKVYAESVLKTQLEQLRKQGSYDAFKLGWHPAYDVRRLHGAKTIPESVPPSLFWESDIGKWIEAVCYFLSSPDGKASAHAAEFEACVQELVDMIERAQQPDGYLNIYFTVVDPAGRFMNLRDMHEMYNAGHLLEGALAHYGYTGSRQFLDVMIRYVDCFIASFGPEEGKLHGYPGHPELELAVLRLYHVTREPRFLEFGRYLVNERGQKRDDQNGDIYFVWEAKERRQDSVVPHTMSSLSDQSYNQSHLPLHEQNDILGHSVRALYLTTAAADLGGDFLADAKRLLHDAADHKMYVTGGLGTEPLFEGFSSIRYRLPQSTNEGGCYAETCASIACMMTCERVLSHGLDAQARDTMELCLLNAVMGGGSLDGKQFSYANKHATCNDETAIRNDWFEVCCCPPNLSRTLGMLGGYTWAARQAGHWIELDVYLFVSATRSVGGKTVTMSTSMPWAGKTVFEFDSGIEWVVRVPKPAYAAKASLSVPSTELDGFLEFTTNGGRVEYTFDLPVRTLASHPKTGQDTLTLTRGPIVYVAESIDNSSAPAHFEGMGLKRGGAVEEIEMEIQGLPVVALKTLAFTLDQWDSSDLHSDAERTWSKADDLVLVPWFARGNRGGKGQVRTSFPRVT